jgi:hypothetical protein
MTDDGKQKTNPSSDLRQLASTIRSPSSDLGHLIAAYRDGLGLVAVTLIAGERGLRLMSGAADQEPALANGDSVQARWWCKSEHAEWLCKPATRAVSAVGQKNTRDAGRAVVSAAKRLGIVLRSDNEIADEASAVIARLEDEIAAQQRRGELKSVNRAYRDYRLAASARSEKVMRYAQWMERYKAKLAREIAQNLRSP